MRKLLTVMIVFLPLALVIYIALVLITANFLPYTFQKNLHMFGFDHWTFTTERLEEAKTREDIDILFVGSSHVYGGIDSRIFAEGGLEVFAMGTPSQTPTVSEFLLRRYLDIMKPKKVVLDLYAGSFSEKIDHQITAVILSDSIGLDTWSYAFMVNDIRVYNTLIYQFANQLLGRKAEPRTTSVYGEYVKGGYVNREVEHYQPSKTEASEWPIADFQVETVKRLIQELNDRGIDYSIIQIPITKSLYQSISNRKQIDDLISTFGPYTNFNQTLDLNDSIHFEDATHLNQLGVELLNNALIDMHHDLK